MNPSPALVFDLDGTLVDTAPDILGALNAVLRGDDRRPMEMGDLRHLVGRGARAMLAEALARTGARLPEARTEELTDAFIVHYRAHISDESRPYPGVEATLGEFAASGARLGVLTNKPQELTVPLLDALGLSRFFAAIHGAGRLSHVKPDARVFHHVVDELGGVGAGAIMIGDSTTDVLTARAAMVPVILLPYGYTPDPVETLGADAVAADFTELPKLVMRILHGSTGSP
ncbi:MAG TPA: HAD-IA family hydrolase [Rhizomicrobium sp.]|jgi:phosphoglycolate phosphatase